MKKLHLVIVLALVLVLDLHAAPQALSIDRDTGALIFGTAPAQFANFTPAQFKIGGVQLVQTGTTVSITGGGTFALGGFTFTVPATGTGVLTSRTITEGNGLAGNTYDLSANRTLALGTPSTNSVSSTNAVTTTSHTHAITSSSNPGAAASILASASDGSLQVTKIKLGSGSAGFTGTGSIVNPLVGDSIRSTTYTSGLVGWNVDENGNAEFDNVDIRGAIHASVIVYGQVQATAGTILTSKSAAKLKTDVVIPSSPTYGTTTVNVDAVDADGLSHASSQLFVVNDILYLKDGLIGATWLKVSSVSDQTTFWRYVCTIQAGTNNVTYRAGLGVADYGGNGSGFIVQTADATNAPYIQMATHAATFTSANSSGTLIVTPQLRIGQLNGSYDYSSSTFGFAVGDYSSGSWLSADSSNGVRIVSGGGNVRLDSGGLSFLSSTTGTSATSVTWLTAGSPTSLLTNIYSGTDNRLVFAASTKTNLSSEDSMVRIETRTGPTNLSGVFALRALASTAKSWAGFSGGPDYIFTGVTIGGFSATTAPTHMLEVTGTSYFSDNMTVGPGGTGNTRQTVIINGGSGTGAASSGFFGVQNNGSATAAAFGTEIAIAGSGTNTKATIYSSSSTYRLHGMGAGTLSTDASGNITATSDETLKVIEGTFDRGMADLRGLKPKKGHWNAASGLDTSEQYVWLTAQDILPHIPEAVFLGQNGKYSVDRGPVLDTVVNALNEIDARLAKLEGPAASPPDSFDRKKLATDRVTQLQARLQQRKAAEPKLLPVDAKPVKK